MEAGQAVAGVARAELAGLSTWHALAMRRRGWTGAGVSGLTVEQCLDFIIEADRIGATDDIRGLKAAVEDLKAYYVEAVTARQEGAAVA